MGDAEPDAYRELRSAREIKAFADPLRLRIIHILLEREATNQQVAAELGESPAKVFHHVRFLRNAGLIRLVETRISGKNVEKFYRAVARNFILRPEVELPAETRIATLVAELDRVSQGVIESAAAWADETPRILQRKAYLAPSQLQAFEDQLHRLIQEHWVEAAGQESVTPRTVLTVLRYHEPPGQREAKECEGEQPSA